MLLGSRGQYNGGVSNLAPVPVQKVQKPSASPGDAARRAVDVAANRQAADVVLLDVRGVSAFNDYMVIMSADNRRQLTALVAELERVVHAAGLRLHHLEGTAESGWVLLDFSDVIVHVFSEEQRAYYRLEQVWREAKTLVTIP